MSKNDAPHQANFNEQTSVGGPTIRKIKLKRRRSCFRAASIENSSDDESDECTISKNPIEEARKTLLEECDIKKKLFEDAIRNLKLAIRPTKQKNKVSNILSRRCSKEEDKILYGASEKQVEKSDDSAEECSPMPALDQSNPFRNGKDGVESESSWGVESESSWGADSSTTESYDETMYSSFPKDSVTKPVTTTVDASRSVDIASSQVCKSLIAHSVNCTSIRASSVSGYNSHSMAIKEEPLIYAETTPPRDQPSPQEDLPQSNNCSLPAYITQQDIKLEPANNEAQSQTPPPATQPCYRADVTHSLIESTALPLHVLSQPVMEVTLTNQIIQTCVKEKPPVDTLSKLTPPPIFPQGAEASDTSVLPSSDTRALPSSTATNGVPLSVKSLSGSLQTSHKRKRSNQTALIGTSNSPSNSPVEFQASNTETSTAADERDASQPGTSVENINIAPSDVPPDTGNVSEQGTSEQTHSESQKETVQILNHVQVSVEGEAHAQSIAENLENPPLLSVEEKQIVLPSQPAQVIPAGKPLLQATTVKPVSKVLQSTRTRETTVPKPLPHSTNKLVSTPNPVPALPFPDAKLCHSPLLPPPFFASPFHNTKLQQSSLLPLPFRDSIVPSNRLPTNETLPTVLSQPLRQPAYLPKTGYSFVINHYGDVDERVNQIQFHMSQFAPLVSSNDSKPSVDQAEAKPITLPLKNETVDAVSSEGLPTKTETTSDVGCVERSPKTEDVSEGDPLNHVSPQSDDLNNDGNNDEEVVPLCRPITVEKSPSFECVKIADGCEGKRVSLKTDVRNEVDLCAERSDREVKGKRKKKKSKEVVPEVDCVSGIGSIAAEELEGKRNKNTKKKKLIFSKLNYSETLQPSGEYSYNKNKKKRKREDSSSLEHIGLAPSLTVESEPSISKKKKRQGFMSLEANHLVEPTTDVKLDTETHDRRKKKNRKRPLHRSEQSLEMVSSTVDVQLKLGVIYETQKKKNNKAIKSILLHGLKMSESPDNAESDVIKIMKNKSKGNEVLSMEQYCSLNNCRVDVDCTPRHVQDTFNVNKLQKQKKNKKGKTKKSYSLGKMCLETVFKGSEAKGESLNKQTVPKKKKKHKKDKSLNNSDCVEPECMKEPPKSSEPGDGICDENSLPKKKKTKKRQHNVNYLPVDFMLDTKKKTKNKDGKKKELEPQETFKCEKKKKKKCKKIDPLESFVSDVMALSASNVRPTRKRKIKDIVNSLAETDSSTQSKSYQSIEGHSNVSCSESKLQKLLRVDRIEARTNVTDCDAKRTKRKKNKLRILQ